MASTAAAYGTARNGRYTRVLQWIPLLVLLTAFAALPSVDATRNGDRVRRLSDRLRAAIAATECEGVKDGTACSMPINAQPPTCKANQCVMTCTLGDDALTPIMPLPDAEQPTSKDDVDASATARHSQMPARQLSAGYGGYGRRCRVARCVAWMSYICVKWEYFEEPC